MATAPSYMAPGSEFELAQLNASRQQKMADMLRQQSMEPLQGHMAGQYYAAPSWTQGLAKMLQAYSANKMDSNSMDALRTARTAYDTKNQSETSGILDSLRGTAARPSQVDPQEIQQSQDQGTPMPADIPAVAPNRNEALVKMLQSQNPMWQGMGAQMIGQEFKNPEWTSFEKPDGKGGFERGFVNKNAQNPISTFQTGGSMPAKMEHVDTGSAIIPFNPYAPPTTPIQKTATPEGELNRGVTIRGQNMTDARKREELAGAEAAFTPEAISNAASRYNIDGTLPPMGMGKAGSAGRAAILNEAAIQAKASGVSGDDQRIAQIGNKANTAALSKLQTQQTMVGSFERNFTKNADIALEQSQKVDRTGVPLANKWINSGKRAITGDPELSAYDAVIKSTANEYAKIISGSMGNTAIAEGEIKKVEALLNSAQTPKQVEAVITMMKRETANRMKGFDEEKAALKSSMTGRRKDDQPGASGKVVDFGSLR